MNNELLNNEEFLCILYSNLIDRRAFHFSKYKALSDDSSIDIDDIKQELNVALLTAIRTYNPKKAAFTTHFMNVANNHMIDYMRRTVSNKRNVEDIPPIKVPVECAYNIKAPDLFSDYEIVSTIDRILKTYLPDRDYKIVSQFFGVGQGVGAGLTHSELSDMYNISQPRVSFIINRALNNPYVRKGLSDVL